MPATAKIAPSYATCWIPKTANSAAAPSGFTRHGRASSSAAVGGRAAIAFWIKRQSGGDTKVVAIGRARRPIASYDLLVAPPQFALPDRPNVINLTLPMARRRAANDDHPPAGARRSNIVPVPKPWFTILLGGEVKQFTASEQALMDAARRAQQAADLHGGSVVVTTSRRTPPSLLAAVEGMLDRAHVYRWSEATARREPV